MNLVTSIHNRVDIKNSFISPSATGSTAGRSGSVSPERRCFDSVQRQQHFSCPNMLLNPFTSFVGRIYIYLYSFFHAHCTAMSSPLVAKQVLLALYGT